ncbi:hypothetical protein BGW36DRAFT_85569 [Talaromyces proteolyticus]|uniref:Telomerase reverse transcriptase n=1 Tax=Talaromyces proteolyticus TaxID=1131652 RepID=A0AAD4KXF9_9EURO|nr:uncharacterized protein BGW36DRAFT_85569 [Talaromyces proteolyticus]KAH8703330.1 hypothetical protein BGW36DRAFT_85569 [Talaromyces proteolyticus]
MGKKRKRPAKSATALATNAANHTKRLKSDEANSRLTQEHLVLSRYYRRVVTLRQYLLEELPSTSKARRRRIASLGKSGHGSDATANTSLHLNASNDKNGDITHLVRLLDTTLVGELKRSIPTVVEARQRDFAAFTQSEERSLLWTDTGPCSPQSEIVDFVIATLFNRAMRSERKPQHVLANGFHLATRKQILDKNVYAMEFNIPGLVSQFPNHHVAALKKAPWTDLLGLLGVSGDDIMIRLLLDCAIFSCVDENKSAFYQISGM